MELIPEVIGELLAPDEKEPRRIQRVIRDAVVVANKEVLALLQVVSNDSNVGTALVLALFRGGLVYITALGDSRRYLFRDGHLMRLTEDHTLADAPPPRGHDHP